MKKLAIVIVMSITTAAAVFAQARPTLAILPFTGGSSGDGETIAELFSFDRTLNGAFTPIPRTSINAAIQKEQNFQMASGMTDPETISRIGKQLGAKYIVAGSITRLGSQQLLVIAIMQIDNLQQIAGEWLAYQNISEVRGKLPEMVMNIVDASRKDTSRLQKLAVLPFQMPSGDREADALAQILAAEIIRTGTYAVFPRTKTLEQVQAEYNTQLSGVTDDYSIAAIGRGDNPLLALSGAARRLGQDRMFNAAIINVESGAQVNGESVDYQVIEDGIKAMQELTEKLMPTLIPTISDSRVANLQALLNAVDNINRQGEGNYTITLTGNIAIGAKDKDVRFTANARKIITIRGDTSVCSLTSQRGYSLLEVPQNITLILGGNLRLSPAYGVRVNEGGTLRMENGATIANCKNSGVVVFGSFTMNGGTINGNNQVGVYIVGGTFTMRGGTISGNNSTTGPAGGGVSVSKGTFTMNGGTISDNTTKSNGGGVDVYGSFTMSGGTINGNTSGEAGGGVHVGRDGTFIKTGGTITADNRARKGNAVYAYHNGDRIRNSAAGPSIKMDSRVDGRAGGWE
jgi:TolB-like protein